MAAPADIWLVSVAVEIAATLGVLALPVVLALLAVQLVDSQLVES